MNYLYLVSQKENNDYETFDSFVCCAQNEDVAKNMDPRDDGSDFVKKYGLIYEWGKKYYWCSSPDVVSVKKIGIASDDVPVGVVCASFNAG